MASYFFLAFLRGTFPPARRASDSPIAIACFRLVTFFPERPLLSVPLFLRCIADLTFLPAALPYLPITLSPFHTIHAAFPSPLPVADAAASKVFFPHD